MGAQREQLADARQRLLGLALLDEADDGIDDRHREDHPGIDPLPHQRRHYRAGEQDIDEAVIEMLEEALDRPVPRRGGSRLGPTTARRLAASAAERPSRSAAQRLQDLVDRQRVRLRRRRARWTAGAGAVPARGRREHRSDRATGVRSAPRPGTSPARSATVRRAPPG